ncbi:MAG TPA: GNAT family N-acetyltransferase [Candidatus Binataceae bacterium]|nr:GNAT family N-acetyltransferase [Candidatus Binataceae bacterium]
MNVRIRNATDKDIPFIGWAQFAAARGHVKRGVWDVMCARDDRDCLAWLTRMAATEEPLSWTRWSNFIIAEVDGHAAAALEGYDPKVATMKYLITAIDQASREMGWGGEIDAINARFMPLESCMHDYEEGAWIVENVACDPKFRRKGLVNMLLEEIFKRGREQKLRVAQLSVFIGNTPAITAYQKQGFRIADEKRSPEFEKAIGCPGQYKMLREL